MSQEATYSVTFKTPKGNLVSVRGDRPEEWVANLNGAASSGALGVIAQIEASLAAPAAAPSQPAGPAADQPAQELPSSYIDVQCDTCGAPAKFQQEGTSKQSGKPYRRYSCTASALHKATFTGA